MMAPVTSNRFPKPIFAWFSSSTSKPRFLKYCCSWVVPMPFVNRYKPTIMELTCNQLILPIPNI